MTAFARRSPAPLAFWLAPLASAAIIPNVALAQSTYGQPYVDPYKSGPTRPFDGSPRTGVYAANPAPSYDSTRRSLGTSSSPSYDGPAIWNGLYIGAGAGYRWANTSMASTGVPDLATKGLQVNGHVGFNVQNGNAVLGLETDLMLGGATASSAAGGTTLTVQDTWTSTVRARLGYATGPALLYVTGGVAIAGQDLTLSSGATSARLTDTRLGYVLGGGFEYKFSPQVSGRVEGLHYSYKDSIVNWGASSQAVKQNSNVLRAGVSYHFN